MTSSSLAFALALPGPLNALTGGTIYDRRLTLALSHMGMSGRVINLASGFPHPTGADIDAARLAFAALPPGLPLVVDGLAFGAMPRLAAEIALARPLVALVHHPLASETGLDAAAAARLAASERAALAHAARVVVTSPQTARTLIADYAVPAGRIAVAIPGTTVRPRARGSTPPLVLNVGSVTPRKDQRALVRALAAVRGPPWRLAVAGSLDRDLACASALRAEIALLGLERRIDLVGACGDAELDGLFAKADLFVSTSRHEGYGMAIAEAMAAGLPVVAVKGGAVAETLPGSAGILVDAGDEGALEAALRACLADGSLRARLAAGALAAGAPTWEDAALTVAGVLRSLNAPEVP